MSFESNIKKMFSEFTEGQKDWFRFNLPDFIYAWLQGDFNRKQLSRNPTLIEDYMDKFTSLSLTQTIGKLDNLLICLWCIRKCHGPIRAPILRRLTRIPNLNGASTVTISVKNSLKPITSWTSNTEVVVEDRNPTDEDYVIETLTAPDPKYVLTSMDIVDKFVKLVLKNEAYFDLKQAREVGKRGKRSAKKLWQEASREIQNYLHEKEFMLYLHPHEELKARIVQHVPDPYARKKKAAKPVKLKIALPLPKPSAEEPNPFKPMAGGMDKFSPKEQYAMVMKSYKMEREKDTPNQMKLENLRHLLLNMQHYAGRHDIALK